MAALDYKSSLVRYHRYLQSVQKQPMFKASLFLVLSLLLIIVLVVAALKPTLVTIASLWGEIKQQREVEKKLDRKIENLKAGGKLLSENEERLALLNEALPAAVQYGKWGKRMESLASQSGVKTLKNFLHSPCHACLGCLPRKFVFWWIFRWKKTWGCR